MVFGVTTGCRGEETTKLKIHFVKDNGTEIVLKIPSTNKNVSKLFAIVGLFAKIVRKYMQLRAAMTSKVTTDRFFLQYHRGKCSAKVIGRHTIAIIPKEIAKFLKLDDYKSYNSQSFQPINFVERGRQRRGRKVAEGT